MFHKDRSLTPSREHIALRLRMQDWQIQFVTTELELALTFASLARTYFSMNKDVQGKTSFENAVRARKSARRWFETLIDPEVADLERITGLFTTVEVAICALQGTVIGDLKMSA